MTFFILAKSSNSRFWLGNARLGHTCNHLPKPYNR